MFYDGTALAEDGTSGVYREDAHTASLSLPMTLPCHTAVNRALHIPGAQWNSLTAAVFYYSVL